MIYRQGARRKVEDEFRQINNSQESVDLQN